MNSSARKLRFGIIGCSRVAQRGMLPALIDAELAQIGMIGSRSSEIASEFARRFGCDSYGTYADVLKRDDIDAVYISLPIGLHEEWTIRAAEAGKHVLCEKSSTTSLASAKRMVAACRKNNVRLLEGFMFRYHPQYAKVISLIQGGFLGKPYIFQGCFEIPFPAAQDIRLNMELGGGVLNDGACYPICASRMLFEEEPLSVVSTLRIPPEIGVDVRADTLLTYSQGKVAFMSSAFGASYHSTCDLWGGRSHLSVKQAYAVPKNMETRILLNTDAETREILVAPEDHFRLMVDDFCTEIIEGGESKKGFESDLLAQARVLEAVRISSREGRIVHIGELTL